MGGTCSTLIGDEKYIQTCFGKKEGKR